MTLPMENFDFISKLIKQLIIDDQGNFDQKNFLFSPASVSTILALGLYMAKNQETRQALMGRTSKNEFLKKIFDHLKNDRNTVLLDQILIDSQNFELAKSVRQSVASIGKEACFKNIDFSNIGQIIDGINQWLSESTNGLLRNKISAAQLDPNAGILMISAANFSGLWSDQFSTEKTKNQSFHITNQKSVDLHMISRMDDKGWFEDNDVKILELDFVRGVADQKASMIFLLPQQRNGLRDLILNKMTGSKLNDWINSTHVTNVWMEIPRFKVENCIKLDDLLTKIGVKSFFDENQIFDGINALTSKKPKVSGFYHCAFAEVNEKGANVPATTNNQPTTTTADPMAADRPNVEEPAPPPQVPKRFIADHPFLFLITIGDRDDKMILFLGQFYGQ